MALRIENQAEFISLENNRRVTVAEDHLLKLWQFVFQDESKKASIASEEVSVLISIDP